MSGIEIRLDYPDSDPFITRKELRKAVRQLSQRGLASSSKWALEMLNSVPRTSSPSSSQQDDQQAGRSNHNYGSSSSKSNNYLSTPLRKNSRNNQVVPPSSLSRSIYPNPPNHSTPALGSSQSLYPIEQDSSLSTSGRFSNQRLPPSSPLIRVSSHYSNQNLNDGNGRGNEIDPDGDDSMDDSNQDYSNLGGSSNSNSAHVHFAPSEGNSSQNSDSNQHGYHQGENRGEEELDEDEEDVFLLAKSHFDSHQLERCSSLLESINSDSTKVTFLKLYARFLISERRMEEQGFNTPRVIGKLPAASPNLIPLLSDLVDPSDPFLLYLKGIIFRKLHKPLEAMDSLIRSVQNFPYNWGAWKELSATLSSETAELEEILPLLPNSFMVSFFIEYSTRETNTYSGPVDLNLKRVESLLELFPNNTYLIISKGEHLYKAHENDLCQQAFELALSIDPYRLDGIADYSNSLFVTERHDKLAQLAHRLSESGKDSSEVSCCIGNYYGSIGDHIKAIQAFKRALRLDNGCSGAWILLGHEYVELKNPHAAAEMYRRGAEINPRDFRAWSGLGKVYELHEAWTYALYYHQKGVALRPYDPRMWNALADTYEKLKRPKETVSSYQRMLSCLTNPEEQAGIILKIIQVLEKDSNNPNSQSKSIFWHRKLIHLIERSQNTQDQLQIGYYARSYLLIARYEMGDLILKGGKDEEREKGKGKEEESFIGNPHLANDFLQKVVATSPEFMEKAEELLKKLAFIRD